MKTSHVNVFSRIESGRTHSASWNKDTQAQLLRVELADSSFFLFPYSQLSCVKFEPRNDHDHLHLRFASHEIQMTGQHLRELGLAFQKLAVDWVKELPARYAAAGNHDTGCIASIKVSEIQAKQFDL